MWLASVVLNDSWWFFELLDQAQPVQLKSIHPLEK
jgi:hypothetical protein